MLSHDQALTFIDNKITIKKLISSKVIKISDVCNFLGTDNKVYEMIFGSASGMKIHQIPSLVTNNLSNLIKVAKSSAHKKFHLNDISTASKDQIFNFCLTDMYLLFSKENLDDFWNFVNFITLSNSTNLPSKNVLSEANLIGITFKYQRSEIDLFERIWWYLTNMFARVLSNREAISVDPQLIAPLILTRKRCFFGYFDMIKNSGWNASFFNQRIDGFEKLFFKYPSDRIPVMFLDTKLYPQKF